MKIISYKKFCAQKYPKPTFLVDKLLGCEEFIILSAPSKAGKSMFVLNLAYAVATGQKFLDQYETQQGKVLYLQTEITPTYLQERLKKITNGFDGDLDLDLCFEALNLAKDDDQSFFKLTDYLEKEQPALIILDPFYTLHGGTVDENVQKEVAPVLSKLMLLKKKYNVAIILVAHQGKQKENGLTFQAGHKHRGSSAFGDVPDGSISLSKNSKGLSVYFELRNHPAPDPFKLTLDPETLRFSYDAQVNVDDEKNELADDILSFFKTKGLESVLKLEDIVAHFNSQSCQKTISGVLKSLVQKQQIKELPDLRDKRRKSYALMD